jgi:hypothetical protein
MITDLNEDRVRQTIVEAIIGRSQKTAQTGFVNICCPMCVTMGTSADQRHRCGITRAGPVVIKCFNCQFKAGYRLGWSLGGNMKRFLAALQVGDRQIAMLVLWAEQVRRLLINNPDYAPDIFVVPEYPTIDLPRGSKSLQDWLAEECSDPDFLTVASYLLSRGDVATAACSYYWTPNHWHNLHRRLIIPCYHDGRVVGWTARAADASTPRYIKELPSNYLFNSQYLHTSRKYVFLVEGVIDALVIDGVATLGASLNNQQIAWINQSSAQPVVVPDRDVAGKHLIEIAIQQGWPVAVPHYGRYQWWEADVKDAAAAVARYGKLYTVQSILATMVTHSSLIRLRTSYSI